MKADQQALSREKAQLEADRNTLKADTKSGRMAAESQDAEKVYKDQQATKGLQKDLGADKPGSLQKKSDEAELSREAKQSKADQKTLETDSSSGRMAAVSPDAEKVYQDKQNIAGEKKDIASDKARHERDEHK